VPPFSIHEFENGGSDEDVDRVQAAVVENALEGPRQRLSIRARWPDAREACSLLPLPLAIRLLAPTHLLSPHRPKTYSPLTSGGSRPISAGAK
jgi:hypothetical protein